MSRVWFFKWVLGLPCLLVCRRSRGQEPRPKPEPRAADGKTRFRRAQTSLPLICQSRRRPRSAGAGLALCTCDTEGHRDPWVDSVGKNGVEVFGGVLCAVLSKCTPDKDERRVCRGNGLCVSAYRKCLFGFGCPRSAGGFAVALPPAVSPRAGLPWPPS